MKFLKNEVFFYEVIAVTVFIVTISVAVAIFAQQLMVFILISAFVMLILGADVCLTMLFLEAKYILINENGITCTEGKKIVYTYEWSQIKELKKVNVKYPTIVIVLKDEKDLNYDFLSFQYGKSAKKALKQYSKGIEIV